jgi:hypothetical protein
MSDYTWNAFNGGNWNTARNWTPHGVPTAADTVDFNTGGVSYTVTGDGTASALTVTADGVTFEGTITASNTGTVAGFSATEGAVVTIDQPAVFTTSSLSFDPGTLLDVSGLLIDTGNGALLGGTADVAVVSGIDADFVAGAAVTLNQLYVNQTGTYTGDVTLNNGGNVTIDTSATFGGGTLTLAGNGTFYVANAPGADSGAFGLTDAVNIATAGDGLVLASDPGVTLDVSGGISGAGFVDVNGGAVTFSTPNTYTGGTVVDAAALTLIGAGAAGTGAVFLTDSTLTISADSTGGAGAETVVAGGSADTINASAGNLLVFGGETATVSVQGGAGSSTVIGGGGALNVNLGAGGGIVFGGSSGADSLNAGTGAATLISASGGTLTAASSASDVLVAAGGNTTLNGGTSTGNDLFFVSGTGSSSVQTGSGTDTVVASGASEQIFGSGGMQDVFLDGGSAQLNFIDGFAGGTMNVVGFASGDTLHLANYAQGEAQSAASSAVLNSGNTIITLSDNTHIVLYGFTGVTAGTFV